MAESLGQPATPAPQWSDYEWRVARASAAIHGVSSLLCGTSCSLGPSAWVEFLQRQREHTLARYRRIEELVSLIDRRARDAGVAVMALKGAALHALGLYVPGERPMADLDLLVEARDAARAEGILHELGFQRQLVTWKHQVFVPAAGVACGFGEHAANPLKVELHTEIGEALPLEITRITQDIWPANPLPGVNPYRSRAALMSHLVLHAAGALVFRALRLVHLHDIALLSASMTAADWKEVSDPEDRAARWWALPPLELAARYYPAAIHAPTLRKLRADCPPLLRWCHGRRTLSDVSLSYAWVRAFPGIEWAQTAGEMFRYAAERMQPTAETLRIRQEILRQRAPDSPVQWQNLSQARRLLRWATSKPVRDETLAAVRAALATTP